MNGRSLGPAPTAGARLHQSLRGPADQEPSLPSRITSRLAGIRGGPQGAVSDVGDPTERLTSLTALRLATDATLYGSWSDPDSTQGVSPDVIDSITWVASPPSRLRTSGRIVLRGLGPRPEPERAGGRGASDAVGRRAVGPRPLVAAGRLPRGVHRRVLPRRQGGRELGGGTLEVGSSYIFIDIMIFMKFHQLVHDMTGFLAGGMIESGRAGHHLEGDPGEPPGHPHMDVAGVLPLIVPLRRQHPEVVVAPGQGVRGQQQRLAESAVAAPGQPARGQIDLIALIPPGIQAGTTGDDPRGGVVDHRPGFAGELAGEGHVDAREGQQPHVGRLHQVSDEVSLDRLNDLRFIDSIVVRGAEQALTQGRVAVRGRRVLGPAQDLEQGAGMDLDPRQACQLGQPFQSRLGDGRRRRITPGNDQCNLSNKDIVKTLCVAGQAGLEVLQDLAAEPRRFGDQVAAMAGQELQGGVGRIARWAAGARGH